MNMKKQNAVVEYTSYCYSGDANNTMNVLSLEHVNKFSNHLKQGS
ncbi:hypothetical protein [Brumicola pallidula]|jgi:hypothetical protein|uniref:Uncharacterized protein n=1 Tax=Brumicola pallidula DSM 14239 = ACAM 615 TaxID=1121922 RepID=K6ZJ15_9ALTE|nr:hypothetical protein [Glaciecola pallidula]GAC28873.1 hypothetical protein GPAL_2012 [Glaciecola pallidula DSM 14239 = ACAM 615]